MEPFSNLIKALASLLWPILGFVVVYLFKEELRDLLRRLKKGKLFGQEVELEASLKQLNASAVAVASEVRQLPPASPDPELEVPNEDAANEILKLAATSPKAALVTLSAKIEKEARELVAITGHLKGRTHLGLRDAVGEVAATTGLPPHVAGSLKQFSDVRNRIVHGHGATDDDVLRALDSGITILKALTAIPRETNVVWDPGVTVYSDPELKTPISGVKGVILETTSPGGAKKSKRIFPSTKEWFKKGQRLSWEWSFDQTWSKAWYKDPETSEIKSAWGSAAEFVGRPLDEI